MREARPHGPSLAKAAIVHLLTDPFADRVLAFGVLWAAGGDGGFRWQRVHTMAEEWDAFRELVQPLPPRLPILHFGEALPRWYETHAFEREASADLEARFVDLRGRLRTAAIYPAPVFGLDDYVRHGLGRDPLRAGYSGAAAIWAEQPDADERLAAKLEADLRDLAALRDEILEAPMDEAVREGVN